MLPALFLVAASGAYLGSVAVEALDGWSRVNRVPPPLNLVRCYGAAAMRAFVMLSVLLMATS